MAFNKQARAAKRHTRKLDGLRKKLKEEKLRKMDSTKAKANVARLLSLSKSDVGLLSLGFAALVLAATAGALIPHFTGAVIDKINGTGHRSEFSLYIIFLLLSGLAQGVFGGLRGGILSAAISRMKV